MSQGKKKWKDIDLKKLRSIIQEDEKNDDKLLAPVEEKTFQPEDVFKLPAYKYMPYRFVLRTVNENTITTATYDTLSKLRATPSRIIKLMQLFYK